MSDIFDILDIDHTFLRDFPVLAKGVADHQTEKIIIANQRKLKVIEERMFTDTSITVTSVSIDEIISRLKDCARSREDVEWSTHDLRVVSYYLVKLQGDDIAFQYAIRLLKENWKNLFFNGIVFYLLNSWNMMERKYRQQTCDLLQTKLKEYKDKNKKYLLLKSHVDFFEDSGPLRMSRLIEVKNASLLDAPTLIGYKQSTISLSFYSDVIIAYFKYKDVEDFTILEDIFKVHELDRTKKLLFANLVEKAETKNDEFLQNQVSKFASRILGDISLSSTWAPFVGATQEEITKLRNAKNLVNLWFARKIIEVFFEYVQDQTRKNFWLQYVDLVKDFRVAGSTYVRKSLERDSRISDMFRRYFIDTYSYASQTAALILCIKNKVIIEFSDKGALYVYNQGHPKISFISAGKKFVDKIDDLKSPSMNKLVDKVSDYGWNGTSWGEVYNFEEQGRLMHIGYWDTRMNAWMKDKIVDSTAKSFSFSDDSDDKIFQQTKTEHNVQTSQQANNIKKTAPTEDTINNASAKGNKEASDQSSSSSKHNQQTQTIFSSVVSRMNSKWLFDYKVKVVADFNGFYVYSLKDGNYHFVCKYASDELSYGSIQVLNSKSTESSVIHKMGDKEYKIGKFINHKFYVVFIPESSDGHTAILNLI